MQENKLTIRGELSLLLVIIINSLGVVLMLHSGSGISAISSVPYAFADVLPVITLGAWTEVFQVSLVLSLMLLSKRFVPVYLFSFVVGSAFSAMIDVHEMWIKQLPQSLTLDIIYFIISYIVICFGVALANRCQLKIIPTDLFPRELAAITGWRYARIKIGFDVICLAITAAMTFFFLGRVDGLGFGTILAAFTMGKVIGSIGEYMDKHVKFVSFLSSRA